jgi:hypothetical protein
MTYAIGTLCGISPGFPRLSPTRRQVSYVLLTRAPLYSSPCGDFLVRLACVRHAASVDSEPGSNSRLKLAPAPIVNRARNLTVPSRRHRALECCEFSRPVGGRDRSRLDRNRDRISRSASYSILECRSPAERDRATKTSYLDVACSTQLSKSSRSRLSARPQRWGGIDSRALSPRIWLGSLLPTTLWGDSLAEQLLIIPNPSRIVKGFRKQISRPV